MSHKERGNDRKLERIWKEAVVTYLKIMFTLSLSGQPSYGLRVDPDE